jgi:hypothetical protein
LACAPRIIMRHQWWHFVVEQEAVFAILEDVFSKPR